MACAASEPSADGFAQTSTKSPESLPLNGASAGPPPKGPGSVLAVRMAALLISTKVW